MNYSIYWTFVIFLFTFFCHEVSMVRLASVRIPKHTLRGQPVRLECHYDLENEALYSVKWYKDGQEFYRFLPGDNPPAQTFNLPGFTVDLLNSTDNVVVLKGMDLDGSGTYRCEVSGEAPAFQTVVENSQMVVVDLPDDGPHIEGSSPRVSIEDVVRVNCTSAKANPAAKLVWHINGEVAEEHFIRRYPIVKDENGLETSILGLQFEVKRHHFKNNKDLKIKCVAKIEDFYWRTNEESLVQDHLQRSPPMESKATYNSEASSESFSSNGSIIFSTIVTLLSATINFSQFWWNVAR